jgi:hypothetical protein
MKVLTANRLKDGVSVWYTGKEWSELFEKSHIAHTQDDESELTAIGTQAYANNEVVDVNLIEVKRDSGLLIATRLRERIRVDGPTIEYISSNKSAP